MIHMEPNQIKNQIKFKSKILKASICDYSKAYILFKGIILVAENRYHCRDETNNTIGDSESLTFKSQLTNKPNAVDNSDVDKGVRLKYLNNFLLTLHMSLVNFEIYLMLTWSTICIISDETVATKFALTDTKVYVPVKTL